jgi:hypothetical protein
MVGVASGLGGGALCAVPCKPPRTRSRSGRRRRTRASRVAHPARPPDRTAPRRHARRGDADRRVACRRAGFRRCLCLPGTHTKWVHLSAGEVVSFRTFMTGELFACSPRNRSCATPWRAMKSTRTPLTRCRVRHALAAGDVWRSGCSPSGRRSCSRGRSRRYRAGAPVGPPDRGRAGRRAVLLAGSGGASCRPAPPDCGAYAGVVDPGRGRADQRCRPPDAAGLMRARAALREDAT